jgi:hypothetical protein
MASSKNWEQFCLSPAYIWLDAYTSHIDKVHLYETIGKEFGCEDYSTNSHASGIHDALCIELIQRAYDKWKLEQEGTPNDAP